MTSTIEITISNNDVSHSVKAAGKLLRIGRSSKCEIHINDPKVSRGHCFFEWVNNSLRICDIGSANGVLFNGVKVERAWLKVGDAIQIGDTTIQLIACEFENGDSLDMNSGEIAIDSMSSSDNVPNLEKEEDKKLEDEGLRLLSLLESDNEESSDSYLSEEDSEEKYSARRPKKFKNGQLISMAIFIAMIAAMYGGFGKFVRDLFGMAGE